MAPFPFLLQLLDRSHDRASFTCGVESLDRYLKTQASQDMRRKANAVFVLVEPTAPARIVGHFSLCAFAVNPGEIPEAVRATLPRYPLVTATLIGRLAVSSDAQGRGTGAALLANGALKKAWDSASRARPVQTEPSERGQRALDF